MQIQTKLQEKEAELLEMYGNDKEIDSKLMSGDDSDNLYQLGILMGEISILKELDLYKKKIFIPLSDNDLEDLQGGETFDWTFDGVDVHLYQTNEDTE